MDDVLPTFFVNDKVSWKKILGVFWLIFHFFFTWYSYWQYVSMGSGNGLVPKIQAITWTNGDPIRRCLSNFTEFFLDGAVGKKSALVQVMAWRQEGAKPLPEPMMSQSINTYMCQQA